jgi:hypothetical protein
MQRYVYTARNYLWVILAVVAVLAASGSMAAYGEYSGTFESNATIWVQRNSQELLQVHAVMTDVPSVPNFLTPGSEYAETFGQLVQTQAFLHEVVDRSSLQEELATAKDPLAYLDDLRKRFKVQALGTNLVKVSFRATSPSIAFEMVSAAVAIRDERAAAARVASASVTSTLYSKEFELAQQKSIRAQQDLDEFNSLHAGPLNAADSYRQQQLRTSSDLAQARVDDLRAAIDRAAIVSTLLQLGQTTDVQVIDAPQIQLQPSGGLRQAVFVFGVMMVGAATLVALLVIVGTLLTASVASEADLERLGAATLVASIPQVTHRNGAKRKTDLRRALSAMTFGTETAKPMIATEAPEPIKGAA